jgi:hypothetical protein
MRGMDETYGMGAGASVKKGKTAKQVRRARKAIDAQKKSSTSTTKVAKPVVRTSKNYSVGMSPAKARQVTPGKPKNYRRSQ